MTGGSLSGVVQDPQGALAPGAKLTLVNSAVKTEYHAVSHARGFYSFPALPVGHYDLTVEVSGFDIQKKTNIVIDADAAVRLDVVLKVAQQFEIVTGDRQRSQRAGPTRYCSHSFRALTISFSRIAFRSFPDESVKN